MNIPITAKIRCPFFLSVKNNLLCCEGYIDNTCMTTKFSDEKSKKDYIKNHCFRCDGGGCTFAENLYKKYKAIEEKEDMEREKRAREKLKKTG
ncbi:MAG: hypothetical protein E7573_02615 [Ruminococcaceae bacterium]|nr:hypothetical protein [Oscillospiraceae bacterium]MBR3595652.1 hypothetical protein [Clostridia bacterium]